MARIILCPDFEYFTHLSPGMRRAMAFASKHGNAAFTLMGVAAGQAGENAVGEFLDALWSTNPDHAEVVASIETMLALLREISDAARFPSKHSHLEAEEIPSGLRWLGARLEELRSGLSYR